MFFYQSLAGQDSRKQIIRTNGRRFSGSAVQLRARVCKWTASRPDLACEFFQKGDEFTVTFRLAMRSRFGISEISSLQHKEIDDLLSDLKREYSITATSYREVVYRQEQRVERFAL